MRFLIILALILVLYYLFKGLFRSKGGGRSSPRRSTDGARSAAGHELVKDPYCQTYIPKDTALRARIGGRERFFCSRECMEKYRETEKKNSSEGG
jgi:YHS domain-containing protein